MAFMQWATGVRHGENQRDTKGTNRSQLLSCTDHGLQLGQVKLECRVIDHEHGSVKRNSAGVLTARHGTECIWGEEGLYRLTLMHVLKRKYKYKARLYYLALTVFFFITLFAD